MPKKLREIDRAVLVELYINQGFSINELADMLPISPAGILTLMRDYGIQTRSISEAKKLRHNRGND